MTNDDEFNKALARFKIVLETRNFEIGLFWQRCNYFLVLNTALAVGVFLFFRDGGAPSLFIPFLICIAGCFVCIGWIKVGLGSKYWQSHWEQVAIEEQASIGFCRHRDRDYFSIEGTKARVKKNLFPTDVEELKCLDLCYKKQVLKKPSVSRWMHRTAVGFLVAWLFLGILSAACGVARFAENSHPLVCLLCPQTSSPSYSKAKSAGMAKPIPSTSSSAILRVRMPIKLPSESNKPPPDDPGEMAASVWI